MYTAGTTEGGAGLRIAARPGRRAKGLSPHAAGVAEEMLTGSCFRAEIQPLL